MSDSVRAGARPRAHVLDADLFHHLKGGATDDWQLLSALHSAFPDAELEVGMEGPGVLRAEPLSDDIVELFVRHTAESGADVFRISDPLNDVRNLEVAAKAIRESGKRIVGCIYFDTDAPFDGDYWRELAQRFVRLGASEVVLLDCSWFTNGQAQQVADSIASSGVAASVERAETSPLAMASYAEDVLRPLAGEKVSAVFAEFNRVRADLGWPPLTPAFVNVAGIQAVLNVSEGERYQRPLNEVKKLLIGHYGRPPAPVDADVRRFVVGQDEPITVRPAELLPPDLPRITAELEKMGLESTPSNLLNLCFDGSRMRSMVASPDDGKQPVAKPVAEAAQSEPEGAPTEQAPAADAAAASPVAAQQPQAVAGGEFDVEVEGEVFRVRVASTGGAFVAAAPSSAPVSAGPAAPAAAAGTPIVAPMQGLLVKVSVKEGDQVAMGDVVAVLEAMKMQNDIVATVAGRVVSVAAKQGDVMTPNQPIVFVG